MDNDGSWWENIDDYVFTTEALRVCLTHNDLLAGNILINKEKRNIRFIDFEYGSFNYIAFDIANHFCEYSGFDSNFEKSFPKR